MKDSKNRKRFGFIAQDVQTIFPLLVSEDTDGFKSLQYTGFLPYSISAMQEQKIIIDFQQTRMENSAETIENLKSDNQRLQNNFKNLVTLLLYFLEL